MNAAEATETAGGYTYTFEVRKFYAANIANHHVLHVTFSIDEHTNLSSGFVREFAQLPRKLWSHDLVGRYSTRVELFYTTKLIRFEAQCDSLVRL
jgi:hypothetical protein